MAARMRRMVPRRPERERLVDALAEIGIPEGAMRRSTIAVWSCRFVGFSRPFTMPMGSSSLPLLRRDYGPSPFVHASGDGLVLVDSGFHGFLRTASGLGDKPVRVLHCARGGETGGLAWLLGVRRDPDGMDRIPELRLLDLIGRGIADLGICDVELRVGFSILGRGLAMVTARSGPDVEDVWMLRSEIVVGLLGEFSDALARDASRVDAATCTRIVEAVLSNSARAMLFEALRGPTTASKLRRDELINVIDNDPESTLGSLVAMRFLAVTPQGMVTLTNDGYAFLRAT